MGYICKRTFGGGERVVTPFNMEHIFRFLTFPLQFLACLSLSNLAGEKKIRFNQKINSEFTKLSFFNLKAWILPWLISTLKLRRTCYLMFRITICQFSSSYQKICLQDKLTATEVVSCLIKILLKKINKKRKRYNAPSNRTRWILLAPVYGNVVNSHVTRASIKLPS